jgi:formate hydrogenlyase subunit 6/NADH:ubiquinone oxidoreductase subunit I
LVKPGDSLVLEADAFDALLDGLRQRGYSPVGPTLRDGAIVLDELAAAKDLPVGWVDEQEGGRYRLRRREDGALFGYAVGPHAWKRYLHPPALVRWRAHRHDTGFVAEPETSPPPRHAFVGVRPCELAAILVQDRVFLAGPFVDPAYRSRRESAFVLAVDCGSPAGTCFCASMGTGPKAGPGFDLRLTEVIGEGRHVLVTEVGTERGAEVAAAVAARPAEPDDLERARAVTTAAEGRMGRSLETDGLKEALYRRYEDPRWDEVAKRCLACANCTMVCPTCFCATVEDETDLTGSSTERRRIWDSCYSQEFSYVHGGSVRTSGGARYRQWITHKLATWHDQFGASGCVGCGRCITWCPVGIDITTEARAVRQGEAQGGRP